MSKRVSHKVYRHRELRPKELARAIRDRCVEQAERVAESEDVFINVIPLRGPLREGYAARASGGEGTFFTMYGHPAHGSPGVGTHSITSSSEISWRIEAMVLEHPFFDVIVDVDGKPPIRLLRCLDTAYNELLEAFGGPDR